MRSTSWPKKKWKKKKPIGEKQSSIAINDHRSWTPVQVWLSKPGNRLFTCFTNNHVAMCHCLFKTLFSSLFAYSFWLKSRLDSHKPINILLDKQWYVQFSMCLRLLCCCYLLVLSRLGQVDHQQLLKMNLFIFLFWNLVRSHIKKDHKLILFWHISLVYILGKTKKFEKTCQENEGDIGYNVFVSLL